MIKFKNLGLHSMEDERKVHVDVMQKMRLVYGMKLAAKTESNPIVKSFYDCHLLHALDEIEDFIKEKGLRPV